MDTSDQPEWTQQRLVWGIGLTPIHVLGILASIYRISRRRKTRQSGLDDHAATLALILDLVFFPTLWLRDGDATPVVPSVGLSTTVSRRGLLRDDLPANIETRTVQVVIGWLVQIVYPLLTWTAKASLALCIARLIPKFHFAHKASIVVACLSALIGLGLVIQTCIFCTKIDTTWTLEPPYRCNVYSAGGIVRLSVEVAIDISLVLIPLCAFFPPISSFSFGPTLRLGLPPVTRRLIQVCFLASLLTTSTAVTTIIILSITPKSGSQGTQARIGFMAFVLSHLTGSVSLLVCNMLIVITSLYRLLRTPPEIVEVGKSPIIPILSHQENSGSEPPSNGTSGTEGSERTTAEGSVSETGGGSGSNATGSYPITAMPSTTTTSGIELTEIFESDLSSA